MESYAPPPVDLLLKPPRNPDKLRQAERIFLADSAAKTPALETMLFFVERPGRKGDLRRVEQELFYRLPALQDSPSQLRRLVYVSPIDRGCGGKWQTLNALVIAPRTQCPDRPALVAIKGPWLRRYDGRIGRVFLLYRAMKDAPFLLVLLFVKPPRTKYGLGRVEQKLFAQRLGASAPANPNAPTKKLFLKAPRNKRRRTKLCRDHIFGED
jgi:hypothetical protein